MMILFRSKVAFVGLFFSVLQKYFQLSLLLMRSLTILGTAKLRLLCLLSIGLKNWGISSDIDAFRPIARERKYLMDYKT